MSRAPTVVGGDARRLRADTVSTVVATSQAVLSCGWPTTGLMPPEASARRDRLRGTAQRDDFVAARLLCRHAAAAAIGTDPVKLRLVQRCPTCGKEDHGPPRIEAPGQVPAISWSHGSGVVAAAHGPVGIGVDVEPRGSLLPDVDARRAVLTAAELRRLDVLADPRAAFFALWTAKEALVKVGSIAMDDFDRVDLGALLEAPRTRWHGWHLTSWSTSGAIGATASVAAMGGVVELSA